MKLIDRPGILLVTGIMASGKSTVAQLLAERFTRSVHLRGDLFRRMIVQDRREVRPDDAGDGLEQLRLRYRLAAQAADTYFEAGFTVIVQDVAVGRVLPEFLSYIRSRPLYLAVLCPSVEAVEQREAARSKKGYGLWTPAALDGVLRDETPRIGLWLDSSPWTPEETADELLKRVWDEGRIG
ncbi:phosphotransferase [Paenibacillus mucilaginosus 3016]|uniref:Phosphotransferase n=1 Tax=Paenibacillus mucilaginosus 3016 TaxID=1116391 RepID=H6NIT7_9BACL|nr:AAA family ATPase [Paenibacillus mucilaginosus]AFC33987.1 phosphotransferase [Paenibacillus mucilaginosus 3016]WFA22354.1 phosphotransferase [Paenibacillus mucilaginosus]